MSWLIEIVTGYHCSDLIPNGRVHQIAAISGTH